MTATSIGAAGAATNGFPGCLPLCGVRGADPRIGGVRSGRTAAHLSSEPRSNPGLLFCVAVFLSVTCYGCYVSRYGEERRPPPKGVSPPLCTRNVTTHDYIGVLRCYAWPFSGRF